MEEILASIRRILNEDETAASAPAAPAEPEPDDDVLVLDPSMMVAAPDPAAKNVVARAPEPIERAPEPVAPAPEPAEPVVRAPVARPEPPPALRPAPAPVPNVASLMEPGKPEADDPSLVAPETAAATGSLVEGLLRTLASNRNTQVHRGGGPTLEDLVREELRPVLKEWMDANVPGMVERLVREELRPPLKEWLDAHLPPLVERLVRVEIEKVVGRSVP